MSKDSIWFNQGEEQLEEEVEGVKKTARKTGKKLRRINDSLGTRSRNVKSPRSFLGW